MNFTASAKHSRTRAQQTQIKKEKFTLHRSMYLKLFLGVMYNRLLRPSFIVYLSVIFITICLSTIKMVKQFL